MKSKLVRDAMSRGVASIDAEAPVARAAERLAERDVGVLAVCRAGDRLSGVITDRDIVIRTVAQGLDPDQLTVGECGTREPVTISPWASLDQAARQMDEQQVRRLPVIEAGRLVGIVSQADLAAHGAHRRAGKLLERMARRGGDRRSARWLLGRPYRWQEEPAGTGGEPGPLGPLVESSTSLYLAGLTIGIAAAILVLLSLGALVL